LPEWWAAAHPAHPDVVKQRERQIQQTQEVKKATTTTDAETAHVQFRIIKKEESKSAPNRSASE
jgi:hypothetical protein